MSKQRKVILIAAAIGVISIFLPWWSVVIANVSGFRDSGIVVFFCFLAAGGLTFIGDQTSNLSQTNWMIMLIVSGLAALIVLISFIDPPFFAERAFGLYISLIAAIALVILTYINRTAGSTLQTGFDALKSGFGSQSENTAQANTSGNAKIVNPTNDPTKSVV